MFSRGLWPGSCSYTSQHQTLSPAKRASCVIAPEGATSRGFFAVSSTLTIFYIVTIFLCYLQGHEFSPRFLNMQQQRLPEIKISSPCLHYQYICVSCLLSRICCATLLLSNVQNQSFSHEPLKKDGEGKKEFRYSTEMIPRQPEYVCMSDSCRQ